MYNTFPNFLQHDIMDCGPTCLKIICKYYGKDISLQKLRDLTFLSKEGVSLKSLSDAAESLGLNTYGAKATYEQLRHDVLLPCILHWNQNHFVVLYKVTKKRVFVSDPGIGLLSYDKAEFLELWRENEMSDSGVVLLLEPSRQFFDSNEVTIERSGFRVLVPYLRKYTRYAYKLILGFVIASIIQLIFPFLTQSIVDIGVRNQNINFIYLILLGQVFLTIGKFTVDIIRSWILLHLSSRLNIALISDFLAKIMKLPFSFFDSKITGDIIQRISDHGRVESFLSAVSLNIVFSFVTVVLFSAVLLIYHFPIFLIFVAGSVLYVAYVLLFLKRRKEIDYKRFQVLSNNQNSIVQLITGMQEIKLNGCEREKRWEWEHIQSRLFRLNMQSLSLQQYQQGGSLLINESKNIFITVVSAQAVIEGSITLGMMLAIQYIIGQLNTPLNDFILFTRQIQDASISLDRINEVHSLDNEDELDSVNKVSINHEDIVCNEITFSYGGPNSVKVLKGVSFTIPARKTTAIVGTSGSGKTTLLKLLLKFYKPDEGEIKLGMIPLKNHHSREWRLRCGVVMQNGFIFSDTIARNIALGDDEIDYQRLLRAAEIANIKDFIDSLPLGFNTKTGPEGVGVSEGQRQRILIARAVYKKPDYLFFDEATSNLDAYNEKQIMENLREFMVGRTVIVIAHRLSTVKNADQIIVLDKGKVVEVGNHESLTALRGPYYNLVKNQLELGN